MATAHPVEKNPAAKAAGMIAWFARSVVTASNEPTHVGDHRLSLRSETLCGDPAETRTGDR
jgi:hypothetical protein